MMVKGVGSKGGWYMPKAVALYQVITPRIEDWEVKVKGAWQNISKGAECLNVSVSADNITSSFADSSG